MKVFNLQLLASAPLILSSTDGFAPVVRNKSPTTKTKTTTTKTILQATIGDTGVAFENVAREWRCKYSPGPSGGPGDSESLKACQLLLEEFVPQVQELLPSATITRQVVCGGCLDFKVSISQPLKEYGLWLSDANYSPLEEEFMSKLTKIDGTSVHETQAMTVQTLLQGVTTQVPDTKSQGLVDANFGLVDAQIKQGKSVVDAQIKAELEGAATLVNKDDSDILVDAQIQGATKAITDAVEAQIIQDATKDVADAADAQIQGAKQAIADSKSAMDAFDDKIQGVTQALDASVKEAKTDIIDKLSE